jgi:sigma-B regulation protein RsbU (phosphoserine phosphatase)
MKVLIAEDERSSSLLMQRLLERQGHEVFAATNGLEALELLGREKELQVVLSDWMMPVMDGIELCRRIRARRRFRYTYVLLATMATGKKSYLEALDAGADDFIPKPIDPEELGARLRVAERILGLQAEMTQLRGLLSICSYCKSIREGDSWVAVERYVSQRADTLFSHGICPQCAVQYFPE